MYINKLVYGILTDGSKQSKMAYNNFKTEFLKNNDDMHFVNLYNPRIIEENEFKPIDILNYFKEDIIQIKSLDEFNIHFIKKDRNENLNNLLKKLNELNLDFIVLGSYGINRSRKKNNRIGTTTNYLIRNIKIPMIIYKKNYWRENNEQKAFNFVILFDNSKKSSDCLKFVKNFANNSEDKVYILNFYDDINKKIEIEDYLKLERENLKLKADFLFFENRKEENTIENDILNYLENNDNILFDFVILSVNGLNSEKNNKDYYGKVSKNIIENTSLNIILNP